MTKMKTSELTGPALDWAVATCELPDGWPAAEIVLGEATDYSTDWSQGGPIIEREMLTVGPAKHQGYMAWAWPKEQGFWGDTPLIAACRCFVASKLGDEVDVPEDLL